MPDFDLIVIGSGPGGSSVAEAIAESGKKVAIIDGLFGGTCALWGCTPKRAMEAVTEIYWEAKDAERNGFAKVAPVDWKALMAHKAKFTALVPGKKKNNLKEKGIEVLEGYATFKDPHTIAVEDQTYTASKIVIATGAVPVPLKFSGAQYLKTVKDFFELDNLPQRIVIVGGGYIGFELSHIMAACGRQVTVLSGAEIPLPAFDPELVTELVKATLDKNIDIRLGFKASKISKMQDGSYTVYAKRSEELEINIEADLVLHAAGRVPASRSLGLQNASIETDESDAIKVNDFLQISNHKHIYALGDVIGKHPFTEVANYEAKIVSHNLFADRRKKVSYGAVPMVVFTHPKLAMVGKKEADCEEEYIIKEASLNNSFIQRCKSNNFARYKTIMRKSDGQILGAHLLGYNADEAINVFAVAMQANVDRKQLGEMLLAYPTAVHDTKHLV